MIKVVITGAAGRMGSRLVSLVKDSAFLTLAGLSRARAIMLWVRIPGKWPVAGGQACRSSRIFQV